MTRGLKYRTPMSNAIDSELFSRLQQLSKDTRVPLSKLLDEAIELLLDKHLKNKKEEK